MGTLGNADDILRDSIALVEAWLRGDREATTAITDNCDLLGVAAGLASITGELIAYFESDPEAFLASLRDRAQRRIAAREG